MNNRSAGANIQVVLIDIDQLDVIDQRLMTKLFHTSWNFADGICQSPKGSVWKRKGQNRKHGKRTAGFF